MERASGGEPRKENWSSVVISNREEEELVGVKRGSPTMFSHRLGNLLLVMPVQCHAMPLLPAVPAPMILISTHQFAE